MIYSVELIFVLLCCSAFFSASETALFSLSRLQIHKFRESKTKSAQMIVQALMKPRKVLTTILLGNELVNVSISIVGAAFISSLVDKSPVTQTLLSVAAITPIIMLFGEITPKNLALRFAPQFSQFAVYPLSFFAKVVAPLRIALTFIADGFIKLFGGSVSEQPMIMEQEYRRLVDLGRREGVIIEEEQKLIHNIFEFSDKVVSSIMTPVGRIFSIDVQTPYDEMIDVLKPERYSRIPFYEGGKDNVIGILHVRDLFSFETRRREGSIHNIREILRPPLFIEPRYKLEDLLKEFRQMRMHLAIVKESSGPILGLITMHDVLVCLFGEMEG